MDSKISAAELIRVASDLISFISFILWCIVYSFIITLQDFYSRFRRALDLLAYLLFKSSSLLSNNNNAARDDVRTSKPGPALEITREDVETVLEKLGLSNRRAQEQLLKDKFEISVSLFDNAELSLDEVREAFALFDGNDDGFIDAEELKRVMSSLGLEGLSEEECKRMIMAFDEDGDGKVGFGEFVKLLEENVCC